MISEYIQELFELDENVASNIVFGVKLSIISIFMIILWLNVTLYPIWKPKYASLPKASQLTGEPGFFFGHALLFLPWLAKKSNPMFVLKQNDIWRDEKGEKIKTSYVSLGPKFLPFARANITIDPINVKHILKDKFDNYEKGELFRGVLAELVGNGIFVSDGHTWFQQRKVASKIFTKSNFNSSMIKVISHHTDNFVAQLKKYAENKETFDIQDMFFDLTVEAILEIAFGYNIIEDPRMKQLGASFDRAQAFAAFRLIHAGYIWKTENLIAKFLIRFFGVKGKLAQIKADASSQIDIFNGVKNELGMIRDGELIDSVAYDIIRKRRDEIKQGGKLNEERTDIVSLFMELSDEDKQTDKQIRDMIISFIAGGRDTTAISLTWLFYELSRHPEIEAKIVEEITQNGFGSNDNKEEKSNDNDEDNFTYDILKKDLPYTTAAVYEVIRLHSPVPIDIKVAIDNDVLPTGEFIQKGQVIAFAPWLQARDPDLWGEDAEEFNPDRWLPPRMTTFPTYFVFPSFQAGPRICLGKDFAVIEIKTVIIKILSAGLRIRLKDPNHIATIEFPSTLLKMNKGLNVTVSKV